MAGMTRSHFQLIAELLAQTGAPPRQVAAFADALAATNERFDRQRFIDAAAPPDEIDQWLSVKFQTGNDDLRRGDGTLRSQAVRAVLMDAMKYLPDVNSHRPLLDRNGNTVGFYERW